MKNTLFISLFFALLLTACDDKSASSGEDDLANIDVTFKAVYGDKAFVLNDIQEYDGAQIRISNLQFFVSNFRVGTGQSGSDVDEIAFVDFSQITDATLSEAGLAVASEDVPTGTYPGINLGIGVPADLNADAPDEYAPSHPLSRTASYWEDWSSYIFLKLEGTMDTDGDGMFDDVSFVYHVGSNPTYEDVAIDETITLMKDEVRSLVLTLDIEKLFVRDDQHLDIEANPRIHSIEKIEIGHYLMDNFPNAITVE